MPERAEVPGEVVERVRAVCQDLPEVVEEEAWVGTRWKVRSHTFAHVVRIDGGWPPAYAQAAGDDGPRTVLTFRSAGAELEALSHVGPPFFKPVWFPDIVGMSLDEDTDWTEVAELLTESYRHLAPKKLSERLGDGPA